MKKLAEDQFWWYLRTRHLVGYTLKPRLGVYWNYLYHYLCEIIPFPNPNSITTPEVLQNHNLTDILLELGYDPSIHANTPIKVVCEKGYLDTVKILLADSRINPGLGAPIIWSATNGHTEVVRLLLTDSRVDPSVDDNRPIRAACSNRHIEVVRLLLADPSSRSGPRSLVSRVDPTIRDNSCLNISYYRGYTEIVTLLLADPRVSWRVDNQ